MRDFFLMMVVQFSQYLILTINYRAIAHNQIAVAMLTDALAVLLMYFIVRKVSRTDGWTILAGMVIGGSLAAGVGIKLTEHWG